MRKTSLRRDSSSEEVGREEVGVAPLLEVDALPLLEVVASCEKSGMVRRWR